ncbi:MAG: dihydropteroate synthase [Bacteroidia bacterium]|nr:dihydropteroate synthase [Bacteroidia bacterium]
MGILNCTPDSFFSESRVGSDRELVNNAKRMLEHGATFIDIGGQSTRPGAEQVSVDEELKRVVPAIKLLLTEFPTALISVDTFYAEVAKQAIDAGAIMVNDVSAGMVDPNMFEEVAKLKVPYVLMHNRGKALANQEAPQYNHLVLDIIQFFAEKVKELTQLGIPDVILDPGFGFGKSLEQNYALLQQLKQFQILELPLLVGVSRKSMVQRVLDVDASNALNGTSAIHMIALERGARILRVHDVKEAVECIKIFNFARKSVKS